MFSEKTSVLRARSGSPEKKSVSPRCYNVSHTRVGGVVTTDIFEVLQQVSYSFPFAVRQHGLVEAIAVPTWFGTMVLEMGALEK